MKTSHFSHCPTAARSASKQQACRRDVTKYSGAWKRLLFQINMMTDWIPHYKQRQDTHDVAKVWPPTATGVRYKAEDNTE